MFAQLYKLFYVINIFILALTIAIVHMILIAYIIFSNNIY